MENFGKGPTLKEASAELRDDKLRIERILTVTETDSVIEAPPSSGGNSAADSRASHLVVRAVCNAAQMIATIGR